MGEASSGQPSDNKMPLGGSTGQDHMRHLYLPHQAVPHNPWVSSFPSLHCACILLFLFLYHFSNTYLLLLLAWNLWVPVVISAVISEVLCPTPVYGNERGHLGCGIYTQACAAHIFQTAYSLSICPLLSRSFINLNGNPLSPSLIQASTLLQERDSHHVHPACPISQSPVRSYPREMYLLTKLLNRDIHGLHWTSRSISFLNTHKYKGASNLLPPHPSCSTLKDNKDMLPLCIPHYHPSFPGDRHQSPEVLRPTPHGKLISHTFTNSLDKNMFLSP